MRNLDYLLKELSFQRQRHRQEARELAKEENRTPQDWRMLQLARHELKQCAETIAALRAEIAQKIKAP